MVNRTQHKRRSVRKTHAHRRKTRAHRRKTHARRRKTHARRRKTHARRRKTHARRRKTGSGLVGTTVWEDGYKVKRYEHNPNKGDGDPKTAPPVAAAAAASTLDAKKKFDLETARIEKDNEMWRKKEIAEHHAAAAAARFENAGYNVSARSQQNKVNFNWVYNSFSPNVK